MESPFSWPPNVVQDAWAGMLEDETFRARFFEKSHRLTKENYIIATEFLEEHGIPYYKGRLVVPRGVSRHLETEAHGIAC